MPANPTTASRAAVLDLLREGAARGETRLRVQGGCMSPRLAPGDVVTVRRARWLWPGDVVAFLASDDRLTVHRVLGYRPGRPWRLLTQADHAVLADSAVPLDRVVGRVVASPAVSWADRARAVGRYAGRGLAAAGRILRRSARPGR